MKFLILVNSAPFIARGSYTAYRFCEAALLQGHTIAQVFFYENGVMNGNAELVVDQDEINLVEAWQQLSKNYPIDLVLCFSAAAHRGVDHNDSLQKDQFTRGGLSDFMSALDSADRLIIFH